MKKYYKIYPVWKFLPLITWHEPPCWNSTKESGNWERIGSKDIEFDEFPLPQQKNHLVVSIVPIYDPLVNNVFSLFGNVVIVVSFGPDLLSSFSSSCVRVPSENPGGQLCAILIIYWFKAIQMIILFMKRE